jgi:hypothetical protein
MMTTNKIGERGRLCDGFDDEQIGGEWREEVGALKPSLMLALTTHHRMINPAAGMLSFMASKQATNQLLTFVMIRCQGDVIE